MRTQGSQNRATPARRRAVVEAAIQVFAERGVANATMEDVARLAGISRGSLYHHFSSREELFGAAFLDSLASITAALDRALVGMGERFGAERAVLQLVRGYLAWHEEEPARGVVVRMGLLDERLEPFVGEGLAVQRTFVATVLERFAPYRKRHEIVRTSDEVLVALIVGPVRDFIGSWYKLRRAGLDAAAAMRDARRVLPRAVWAGMARSSSN